MRFKRVSLVGRAWKRQTAMQTILGQEVVPLVPSFPVAVGKLHQATVALQDVATPRSVPASKFQSLRDNQKSKCVLSCDVARLLLSEVDGVRMLYKECSEELHRRDPTDLERLGCTLCG